MREFNQKKGTLYLFKKETKIIYSLFLGLSLLNYLVMFFLGYLRAGYTYSSVINYYLGNEAAQIYPKTTGELLETAHYHLFAIPIFLLTQGHILLLSLLSIHKKILVISSAFIAAAIYMMAPFAIVFLTPIFAYPLIISRLVMVVAALIFFIVPIKEMWLKPK